MHASNSSHFHIGFRFLIDAVLLVCLYFGWWYVALPLGTVAFLRFPYYFELLAAGFTYDALYGFGLGVGFWATYGGTLATGLISAVGAFLKGSFR